MKEISIHESQDTSSLKLTELIKGRPERENLAKRMKAFGVDLESIIEVMHNLDVKVSSGEERISFQIE